MAPSRRNLIVGSVVLVALLALAWMILRFSSTSAASLFSKGFTVHLEGERADGVSDGSPVFYLGVNVGRVLNVRRLEDKAGVMIDVSIDAKQPLPENVHGVIRQQSPLSNAAAINLEPVGQPSAKHLADGAMLEALYAGGGVIPPEFTEMASKIREQQIIEHTGRAIASVEEVANKVSKLLDQVNSLAGDPRLRDDVRVSIANVRRTSENLQQFSARLDEMSGQLKETLEQVRKTVGDGGQRVNEVARNVDSRLEQVGDILTKLQSAAAKIDKGEGTAGRLVNDPRVYDSLADTSRELSEAAKALKRLIEQWEKEGLSVNKINAGGK